MSRTARLLEILIRVDTKPRFTVQELAEELGVSRRTMLRDLHALSEMGVPLAATPGPHGGYSLIRDRRLLPLSLSPDEAIGIILSYEAFLQFAQSPFAAQSLSAITKLRNAMPPDIVRELDAIRERVAVVEPQPSYQAPRLPDILRAALEGVHLHIRYDSRSRVSDRLIYPHGLFAAQGFWYCVCYDYERRSILSLRVDRVVSLRREEGLEPRAPLSLREWLQTRERDAEDQLPLRAYVTRRGARDFEVSTLFGDVELDESGRGVIESSIPATEVDFFASRLLTLGAELLVESPVELVQAMRQKAREIAELYGSQPEKRG